MKKTNSKTRKNHLQILEDKIAELTKEIDRLSKEVDDLIKKQPKQPFDPYPGVRKRRFPDMPWNDEPYRIPNYPEPRRIWC